MPSVMPMVISFTTDTLLAMPVLENCFTAWMALPDIAEAGDGFRPGGKVWCRRASKNEKLSMRRYLAAVVSMRKWPSAERGTFSGEIVGNSFYTSPGFTMQHGSACSAGPHTWRLQSKGTYLTSWTFHWLGPAPRQQFTLGASNVMHAALLHFRAADPAGLLAAAARPSARSVPDAHNGHPPPGGALLTCRNCKSCPCGKR